jgi:hypothetical protein
MSEPGLDLHEWESQWASVAEEQDGDTSAALSQYAEIVEHMLVARGYNVADPVETAGDDPEIVRTYAAAREVVERAGADDASRADIGDAIEDLRALFETLTAARP